MALVQVQLLSGGPSPGNSNNICTHISALKPLMERGIITTGLKT